jgi:hypothetical protein
LSTPSDKTIKDLIDTGNPSSLAISDNTWIVPGKRVSNFHVLDSYLGADVTVIVVDLPTGLDVSGPTATPIVAFAGFHIDVIDKTESVRYIDGHFVQGTTTNGSGGIGPFYGTYTPARLAQ